MNYNLIRITEGQETILATDTDLEYLERERTALIDEADNSMNLFRITVDPEEIEAAIDLMPCRNGREFCGDWAQDFGEFTTEGPDWTIGIPADSYEELKEASEYSVNVAKSIEFAKEFETKCIQALRRGDWQAAIEAAEAAYREELQWGDAPSYGPLYRFLRD